MSKQLETERFTQPTRSDEQVQLVERAKSVLPGGTTNVMVQPEGREFIAERGEGAYIYDVDGRRYLDYVMGAGPLIFGHAHPRILEAIRRSAANGTTHFAPHRRTIELAERLCEYVPSAEMVRFTSSGSEATLHALRLARAVTGRDSFVKFDGGYHGHHDLATWSYEKGVTEFPKGTPESAGIQKGVGDDVFVAPFNDPEAVRALFRRHPKRFAAVIVEPFQRALAPETGFLETLRAECDRDGTVLIFDEVVTGFRFGPGTAQERYGVIPDLTTLGKGLSGGLPLCALVGRRWLMEHLDPASPRESKSFHCGTLNGHLLAVECAHTALDILMLEGGMTRFDELGAEVREQMSKALADAGATFFMSGDGGIFQPYFTEKPVRDNADVRRSDWEFSTAFHLKLLDAGVYKVTTKGYLSLVHEATHIEELCDATKWAVAQVQES